MVFTEDQLLIAKSLVASSKTIEQIAKATELNTERIETALADLEKQKLITKKEQFYEIKQDVAKALMKRREIAEKDKFDLRLKIVIEAQSIEQTLLEKELKKIEEALKKEPEFTIYDCVLEKTVQEGEHYSSYLEVNLSVKDFASLVHLMVFYGPTSIEIIKPNKITISADVLQDGLVDLADIIQSYTHYIAQNMNQQELREFQKKIFS